MQREDYLSNDVIKIFHNAKISVKNNVEKWVDNENYIVDSKEPTDIEWNSNSQRDQAAGEYEPLQERNTPYFNTRKKADDSKKHDTNVQIDEDNRILLENEKCLEDIEDIRSEYKGNIGDKR